MQFGGAGLALGILVGLLLGWAIFGGDRSGAGGNSGGGESGQRPEKLIGEWKGELHPSSFVLELKANGRFEHRTYFRTNLADKQTQGTLAAKSSGEWKVERMVEGKFKVQVIYDSEPKETYGWLITLEDGERIKIEGQGIDVYWSTEPLRRSK